MAAGCEAHRRLAVLVRRDLALADEVLLVVVVQRPLVVRGPVSQLEGVLGTHEPVGRKGPPPLEDVEL